MIFNSPDMYWNVGTIIIVVVRPLVSYLKFGGLTKFNNIDPHVATNMHGCIYGDHSRYQRARAELQQHPFV